MKKREVKALLTYSFNKYYIYWAPTRCPVLDSENTREDSLYPDGIEIHWNLKPFQFSEISTMTGEYQVLWSKRQAFNSV